MKDFFFFNFFKFYYKMGIKNPKCEFIDECQEFKDDDSCWMPIKVECQYGSGTSGDFIFEANLFSLTAFAQKLALDGWFW